jgi:hypothetical protein
MKPTLTGVKFPNDYCHKCDNLAKYQMLKCVGYDFNYNYPFLWSVGVATLKHACHMPLTLSFNRNRFQIVVNGTYMYHSRLLNNRNIFVLSTRDI